MGRYFYKRSGEQGVSFKARLLYIGWIKVDGNLVYKAEAKAVDAQAADVPASEPVASEAETPVDAETPATADSF